jgi:hypothetical protein
MLCRWWHTLFALALVLGGVGGAPRARAEGPGQGFHAEIGVGGAVASVKRVKGERGARAARTARAGELGVLLAAIEPPVPDRAWVLVVTEAAPAGRPAEPPRTAPARAPPA